MKHAVFSSGKWLAVCSSGKWLDVCTNKNNSQYAGAITFALLLVH